MRPACTVRGDGANLIARFLLPFEGESGLSLRCFVDRTGGRLLRLMTLRLADGFCRSLAVSPVGGQIGVFLERHAGADRTLQYDARLRHSCRYDVWSSLSLAAPWWKRLLSAPAKYPGWSREHYKARVEAVANLLAVAPDRVAAFHPVGFPGRTVFIRTLGASLFNDT